MTDQNTKLPSNQQAKWPDPPWSIPPYVVDTVHSISTLSIPAPATPGPFDWVLSSNGVKADIDFNFNTNQVLLNGSVSKAAILQTTTRASTAWADDINGNWSSFGSGIPRVTSKGYLYEGEARTNSIRCSDMTGAVVADGIERTTNGNFALNPINASQNTLQNGWQWTNSSGSGTVTWNGSSSVTVTGDGVNGAKIGSAVLTTVIGLTYTLSVDVSGATIAVQAGTAAFGISLLSVNSVVGAGQKFQFVATSTTSFISFQKNLAVAVTVANISVVSAGKLPNNWVAGGTLYAGLIATVVNPTQVNGINVFTVNFAGTSNATSLNIFFDNAGAPASYGQTWTQSTFLGFVGGSNANITAVNQILRENSGSTGLSNNVGPNILSSITTTPTRFQFSKTLAQPTTDNILMYIALTLNNASAINVTLQIGWPQEELNPSLDSGVASAAVHSGGGGSGYANGDTGTISGGTANTAATYTVTGQSAGVVTSVSVTAGDYTVLPPNSGSGVATASGGAQPGSGTGLLLDLTPVNQVSFGYGMASSPIPTTSAAVTRAADTNLPFSITTGTAVTLYVKAIPEGTYAPSLQTACQMDDGSGSNRIIIDYIQTFQQTSVISAGSNVYSQLGSGWSAGVSSWIAVSSTAGAQLLSIDGVTKTSGTGAQPIGMNSLRIGSYLSNLLPFMGYIQRVSVFSNTALPQLLLNGLQ